MTDLFNIPSFNPFSIFGFTDPFWNIHTYTLVYTWVVLGIVVFLTLLVQYGFRKEHDVISFAALSFVKAFKDLCTQTLGSYSLRHTTFILTLFTFILISNVLAVIPGLEEPTSDLNTTLALGITSFCYVQFYGIRAHGIKGYVVEFLEPFFLMLPLNIIGELASVLSMSFRLFGNIFGGLIISHLYLGTIGGTIMWELIGLFTGVNMIIILFLGVFTGVVQAFVFSILSLTYLSLATQSEDEDHE